MIAWEPWDSWRPSVDQPGFSCAAISSGVHDALIREWARAARADGRPILLRFAPEQNGDWRPWSVGVQQNTGKGYIKAWRHVVDLFRGEGAANVVWVWNPYVEVGGSTPMAASFPGRRYVDMIGLDGFNWGSTRPWGWQDYSTIFGSSVPIVKRLAGGKPWLIAETASAQGPDRPAWAADLVRRARADGAASVVWFEFNKETDWRLAPDAASSAALSAEFGPAASRRR